MEPTFGARPVVVAGAGLAGALAACYLRRKGFNVHVFERRPDPRKAGAAGGRSINLAISERGITAIKGIGLLDDILNITIPMFGRQIHALDGKQSFQPYSSDGKECIRSVSRGELNKRLIDLAEKAGATLHFEKQVVRFSARSGEIHFTDGTNVMPETVIAADGAYSPTRRSIMNYPYFNYEQQYHKHGYKELCILPKAGTTEYVMEKNALHIWPRGNYMMIALPNLDGSFTCTLFMPLKGEISFETLDTKDKVKKFFNEKFSDAVPLMPTLLDDYFSNPTGALMTVRCFPWSVGGKCTLVGDAAHAVVPFMGQGCNASFEDVRVLDEIIAEHLGSAGSNEQVPWERIFAQYETSRKPNADAIADIALENYIEMRDKVADQNFQFRQTVAAKLGQTFPDQFKSRYELVSFSNIDYAKAYKLGETNGLIIDELVKHVPDHDVAKIDMNVAKQLLDKYFPR